MEYVNSRYNRQEAIPKLGRKGQDCLLSSRVAVIGAGGVKCPLLYYLCCAGVGFIRIIDFDQIELSNLNRQILYTVNDIGKYKAEVAAQRLTSLNPEITLEAIVDEVTESNFDELLSDVDLVFEGGNSADSRKMFNRKAIARNMVYIHASAQFNYSYVLTVQPLISACFECVYKDLPASHAGPVPVIGCATGIAGAVAATEAINILIGNGPTLTNRIWLHNGWSNRTINIPTKRKQNCSACSDSAFNTNFTI